MKYIFGNWKMYLDEMESIALSTQLRDSLQSLDGVICAVFPNTLSFCQVRDILKDSGIALGAQHVSWTPKGAYTGATSAELFHISQATYALVGHSERRHVFGESNEDVRQRFLACREAGITPVLCVGETREDRESDKTEYRIRKQIMKVCQDVSFAGLPLFIAYEPVWAIGTGDACVHTEAARMIAWIKDVVKEYTAGDVVVLYGGSVDESNAHEYVSHGIIDGLLIGSVSIDTSRFKRIVECCVL